MADPAVFESFFQQADADRDGKVSGTEAIQFFKGFNLPQPVLAKIWHAADHGHTGFLSRPEFYNALKLVTVAQSGRELTPEIMKAALVGPASLKIPAPKIQASGPQPVPQQQQQQQQSSANLQLQSSSNLHSVNLQQANSLSSASGPQQTRSSISSLQPGYHSAPPSQVVPRPVQRPSTGSSIQGQMFSSAAPRPITQNQSFPTLPSSQFQQDAFSSSSSQPPPNSAASTPRSFSAGGGVPQPGFSAAGSKAPGFDSPFGSDTFSVNSGFTAIPTPPAATAKQSQPVMSPHRTTGGGAQAQGFRPPLGIPAWPKMTTADVQRYSRVFLDVDTDKDGKITGVQARDLFMSFRLPREVLKQVWDLSDQDGDSMLSLREFCTALYLMERFREGRPLPPVLPVGFHIDDGPPQSVAANRIAEAQAALAQHSAGYNLPSWQRNPRGMVMPTGQEMQGGFQPQHMARNARNRRSSDTDAAKPVQSENKVLDSKEKLDFYRNKLQEIVLLKRKCDNRLAEITDKAAAEKREEELMAKKYEEKYKQALEANSRLVSEEAALREIQTLKLELRNSIAEIERGGNPNALLQTRSDRISNDLDELEKALVQRGQLLGFHVSGTTPVELPFGWKPGLQENAVEWDEDWDKFDDEGYTTVQGIMDEPDVPRTTSSIPGWDDGSLFADDLDVTAEPNKADEHDEAVDSPRAESETSSLKSGIDSPQWSPKKKSALGSSPLSLRPESSESHEEEFHIPPPAASFDQEPSFDGDHYGKPWASAFTSSNDDLWGLQDSSSPSIQPVKTRTERDSLDLGSLNIHSPVNGEVHNENDFFGAGDSISVPSTPLFKDEARRASFFEQDSRRDSFASSQGRTSIAYDDTDPFGDTGPFNQKSDRWSTF